MKKLLLVLAMLLAYGTEAHVIEPQKEEIVDIIADVFFIATDVVEIVATGGSSGWLALGADIGCAFTPGATGGGNVVRGVQATRNVARGASAGVKVAKVVKFNTYQKKARMFLDNSAYVHWITGRGNPFPKLDFRALHKELGHALEAHGMFSTMRKSKFLDCASKKDFLSLLKNGLERMNSGKEFRVLVSMVGGKPSYTFLIDMGKKVGQGRNDRFLRVHWNPGTVGKGDKYSFTMFPCSQGSANNMLNRKGIKSLF
jgi:hypothetical protein